MADEIYGLMAEFATPEALVAAAGRVREAGYRRLDAFTPFAIEGLSAALGIRRTRLPLIVLIGGVGGASGGFLMQSYAHVVDYPWNVAGRAYWSWQAFIPITFELGILGAALSAVLGMILLNRLPRPYHPAFNTPGFRRASVDRFFLCVEAEDPLYRAGETAELLRGLGAARVSEVPCWPAPGKLLPADRRPPRMEPDLAALNDPSPVTNERGVSNADQP